GRLLRLPNIPEYSELQGNLDARYQVANPSLRYLLSQQSQPSPIMKRPAALWNWAGRRARCPRSGYLYTDSDKFAQLRNGGLRLGEVIYRGVRLRLTTKFPPR